MGYLARSESLIFGPVFRRQQPKKPAPIFSSKIRTVPREMSLKNMKFLKSERKFAILSSVSAMRVIKWRNQTALRSLYTTLLTTKNHLVNYILPRPRNVIEFDWNRFYWGLGRETQFSCYHSVRVIGLSFAKCDVMSRQNPDCYFYKILKFTARHFRNFFDTSGSRENLRKFWSSSSFLQLIVIGGFPFST